jgi:hypothetical protein
VVGSGQDSFRARLQIFVFIFSTRVVSAISCAAPADEPYAILTRRERRFLCSIGWCPQLQANSTQTPRPSPATRTLQLAPQAETKQAPS